VTDATLAPLEPVWTAELFPPLGEDLVALLRSLPGEDWARPTVCSAWSVRDVIAHLLDTALRRIAADRDDFVLPPGEGEVTDYRSLVGFLDRLNAEWVTAQRRLSPRLLTELVEWVEPRLAATIAALDPDGPARFPVSWAGEGESRCWFDVARELTERWLHQQQIRLAVGAPALRDPRWSRPVFETFLRALPHRYRETEAGDGERVQVRIEGAAVYDYCLRREGAGWRLLRGAAPSPTAAVRLDEETAWLLLTKGLTSAAARERASIDGEEALAAPFFDALAVMA
jgi:uncharacterized protein (TIGR03083 family)